MDATTPNIVAPTMLRVVTCMLAVVCKRMQQLPTMLGAALHHGKDTTHKSLLTMRNERARPQKCWKSCANGSNIIALRFGDQKCWELLAEKFDRFQTLRNNTQQHPTTCNRVCKRTQNVTSNNVASVCTGLKTKIDPNLNISVDFYK